MDDAGVLNGAGCLAVAGSDVSAEQSQRHFTCSKTAKREVDWGLEWRCR